MANYLELNKTITLKNQTGKIVEIENKCETNHISSIGKVGPNSSMKKFQSSKVAIEKANQFIEKKIKKGYQIQVQEIKGEYLEKGDEY